MTGSINSGAALSKHFLSKVALTGSYLYEYELVQNEDLRIFVLYLTLPATPIFSSKLNLAGTQLHAIHKAAAYKNNGQRERQLLKCSINTEQLMNKLRVHLVLKYSKI